ncbi:MAG: 4Fe-4S dicluster domain-containing protein [Planctomycetaceae bacterium]|nr:4Fe-4S dicluster domain-containing protein [Planctomycetaceae bacterium]
MLFLTFKSVFCRKIPNTMPHVIDRNHLNQLIRQRIAGGTSVAGLTEANGKRYFYRTISNPEKMVFDSGIMPFNSIKQFLFPQSEPICSYRCEGKDLIVSDAEPFVQEQVVFGVRPCDAASLPILDKVFAWDFQDRFYQQRRAKTTVVTLACKEADKNCFCTSVGLAPDTQAGADAMLLQIDAETFEVRTFTEKGAALFQGQTAESEKTGKTAEPPKTKFDAKRVELYLKEHFNESVFDHTSMRCVGCGGCTYVCPTCHCFDIVDEGGTAKGKRVKNWDACQFSLFTLHASGHNPRAEQPARQRNRVQHKFCIYPEKFGMILCTGCGNCTRVCTASLGIHPVLALLDQKAAGKN